MNRAHPHAVGHGAIAHVGRVNVRSAFWAKVLGPFVAALRGLDIDGQFTAEQVEGFTAGKHDRAIRRTRYGLAIGAVTNDHVVGIDLGLIGYVTTVAPAVDSHMDSSFFWSSFFWPIFGSSPDISRDIFVLWR